MPYNERIDKRISEVIKPLQQTQSKKMFGGVCHLIRGNMFCGVYKDFLILRLGVEKAADALQQPHTKPFDITGKSMKGWVMVSEEGFKTQTALNTWLEMAVAFARTLPSK